MKNKIINLLIILSSLIGFLEWGKGNTLFLFQAEWEIFTKLFSNPLSVIHPFTILPLLGQIILAITIFQSKPGKILTYSGIACIGILLLFMLLVGIISLNIKIILSTLPFVIISIIAIRQFKINNKN